MRLLIGRQGKTAFVSGELEALLRKGARLCVLRMKADPGSEAGLIVTNDREIQKLNYKYRGIDRPTDVLSFPTGEMKPSGEGAGAAKGFELIKPPYLGDIVISADRAAEQAVSYGHSYDREMAFLTVHGMLHLLGLDHETDEERARMEHVQRQVLLVLGTRR